MADPRVLELVDEALATGQQPEAVCRACPELLPAVRRLWRAYHELRERVDEPATARTPGAPGGPGDGTAPALPAVPGHDVLATLGAGGMGVVYLARHRALGRHVAVKMLLAGAAAGSVERERLLREARAMATLRHPHIVGVHEVGEIDGRPFFTMEYLAGGSLATLLAGQPRAADAAARMAQTLAEAVAEAHRHGIVHRDLKPANVLVDGDGALKIGDFGIARSAASDTTITHPGARLGTPSYMAPEQALGRMQDVGPATDVHALGALLYELLTGKPPFRAASAAATERQLLQDDAVPPRVLVPGVPRDLETICLHCLHKDPRRRYPTARELADDLGRFRRGEPVLARRVGPLERCAKWVRRRPLPVAAAVAALVVLGTMLGVASWAASQRAAVERAIADDLREVVRLQSTGAWRAAGDVLARARTRLGAAAHATELAARVQRLERELAVVERLFAMRLERATSRDAGFDQAAWWRRYHDAFTGAGLLVDGEPSATFAARVAGSTARAALVEAMDDWCVCATSDADLVWLLAAARLADPSPGWRDRARDVAVWRDRAARTQLVREADVAREPVGLLLNLAGLTHAHDPATATALLRRLQAERPGDLWANFALADVLDVADDHDAIAFYRAALALRPDAAMLHAHLGLVLQRHARYDEAADCLERALVLGPGSSRVHYNLASLRLRRDQVADAAHHAALAVQLEPDQPQMRGLLAHTLMKLERHQEAVAHLQHALARAGDDAALRARLERMQRECEVRLAPPAARAR